MVNLFLLVWQFCGSFFSWICGNKARGLSLISWCVLFHECFFHRSPQFTRNNVNEIELEEQRADKIFQNSLKTPRETLHDEWFMLLWTRLFLTLEKFHGFKIDVGTGDKQTESRSQALDCWESSAFNIWLSKADSWHKLMFAFMFSF